LNNMLQGGPPVPGAAVPPSYIVSVLKRAAAASGSADDLAVYNDLFPAVLREVANPQQLLEVLAAISAQVRPVEWFCCFLRILGCCCLNCRSSCHMVEVLAVTIAQVSFRAFWVLAPGDSCCCLTCCWPAAAAGGPGCDQCAGER
jgi:hypothetical protein